MGKTARGVIAGISLFAIFGLTCAVCLDATRDDAEVTTPADPVQEREQQAQKDLDQCAKSLSYGNNWVLEEQIKARLTAPRSYEFDTARVRKNSDGQLIVVWEFYAKNAFGVEMKYTATGIVWDASKCANHEPGSTELLAVDLM